MQFLYPQTKTSIPASIFFIFFILFLQSTPTEANKPTKTCRPLCGTIKISFPLGIDDGCGSIYFRRSLTCTPQNNLLFSTPSSLYYTVLSITYSDPPHLLLSHPSISLCNNNSHTSLPFSIQTGTHFHHSPLNTYLFFNCTPHSVFIKPLPFSCERSPERCVSVCDPSSYFCLNLPTPHSCPLIQRGSCCSYFPRASESLGLMLQYCTSYTSVHWRRNQALHEHGRVAPQYGSIMVDFDIPLSRPCSMCMDGGGTCGFHTRNEGFLCLCRDGTNSTTTCTGDVGDGDGSGRRREIVAGAGICLSFGSCLGIGAGICYLRKVRRKESVVCGVQSTENRLF